MPSKTKIIPNIGASIHVFMNGFSFCTPTKTDFIPFSDGIDTFKEVLKELIDFYPKQTFAATQVVYYHQPSTFVPVAFFDADLLPNYLQLYGTIEKSHELIYEEIEALDQVQVYAYPKEIHLILKKVLSPVYCCHYNSILLTKITEISKTISIGIHLFIHLQNGGLDLYLVDNSTVVFQNHFKIKNEDEFLYYVFFVVEQFKLKTDGFQIRFLGQIPSFESYYKAIKQYHKQIFFEMSNSAESIDSDQHPAPFLAQIFN